MIIAAIVRFGTAHFFKLLLTEHTVNQSVSFVMGSDEPLCTLQQWSHGMSAMLFQTTVHYMRELMSKLCIYDVIKM